MKRAIRKSYKFSLTPACLPAGSLLEEVNAVDKSSEIIKTRYYADVAELVYLPTGRQVR